MFISSKTIYFNKETNHIQYYLCDEMKSNKLFCSKEFWTELLNKRVDLIAEVDITREMEKRRNSIGKGGSSMINDAIGKIGKFGQMGKKWLGFGGQDNKAIEKEILFNQFFQKNSPKYCDKVICVTVDLETQKQRVMKRDNISEEEFLDIYHLQMNNTKKCELADLVLNTGCDLDKLEFNVKMILDKI